MASCLTAVGSVVNVATSRAELDASADLLLAELVPPADELKAVLAQLGAGAAAALVVPKPGLPAMLGQFATPAVKALLAKDHVTDARLAYVGSKLLFGNIFGLSKLMPWGVKVYSEVVGSHEERGQALAAVSQLARVLKVRPKAKEAIELVADELLMNALYDAPVDPEGRSLFGEVQPRDRSTLRLERPTVLQFACDGTFFAVSVRDSFGSLRRATVLDYLNRCVRSADPIERKTAGAGLGLYLVASNVTELVINLLPGVATEVVCLFDLRTPGHRLMHFGIYEESGRAAGDGDEDRPTHLVSTAPAAARERRGQSPMVGLTLAMALALFVVAAALFAWPILRRPARSSLTIETEPPGATIYLNGAQKGVASGPLSLPELDVSSPYVVTARRPGYGEAREVVSLRKGAPSTVRLVLPRLKAKLRVTSTPEGAEVWIDGRQTGQKTPALLDEVDPDKAHAVRLTLHGFKEVQEAVTVTADKTALYHGTLSLAPDFAVIAVTSEPVGARLWVNDVDTGLVTPVAAYAVPAGRPYRVRLTAADRVPWEQSWTPSSGGSLRETAALPLGGKLTVLSNVKARLQAGDGPVLRLPVRDLILREGTHTLTLRNKDPYLDQRVEVVVKAGGTVTRELVYGFVAGKTRRQRLRLGDHKPVATLALPRGEHEVTVVDLESGKTYPQTVRVEPGKTVRVP
ncbi:MAG: PEGA domain-containing protein [Deltaproteobacteria bacterium]|nr:PEGA domain-containing protein [Deltaproteobacteria bacterium]